MKTDKRGFTLIEVLSVITIIAIIIAIAVPTVTYLIRKQRKNYYQSLESNVAIAGRDYFNSNRNERPTELLDNVGVTLSGLIADDYITKVADADGDVTNAAGDPSCEGYVYAVKNEKNDYDYFTCMQCNCSNNDDTNTCEYVSQNGYCDVASGNNNYEIDELKYGNIWLYVNSDYKASLLTAGIKISRTLGDKDYTISDSVNYSKIYENGTTNETTLNTTLPTIYQLKYEYKYGDDNKDLFENKVKRNLIIYQYEAPTVTYNKEYEYYLGDVDNDNIVEESDANSALRFAGNLDIPTTTQLLRADLNGDGSVSIDEARIILRCAVGLDTTSCYKVNYNNLKASTTAFTINNLSPNGILPDTTLDGKPAINVKNYLYSYKVAGSDDWSSWQIVDCGSQTDNIRSNCSINVENLSGLYDVRFAFNDIADNISAIADSYLRIKRNTTPPSCPTLTASGTYSSTMGSNWYRSPVNITFSLPSNVIVNKSYINNSAGTEFVSYNQADKDGNNYIDHRDAAIILRKAAGLSSGYILGDYDGNGDINLDDSRNALRAAVGLDVIPDNSYLTRADIDGDGIITITDARTILRCSAGLESCPTVEYKNNLGDVDGDNSVTITDARLTLRFETITDNTNYIEVSNYTKNSNNYTIFLNDNNYSRTGKFIIKDSDSGLTNTCYLDTYQIDRTPPTVAISESNGNNSPYESSSSVNLLASTSDNISGQSFQWKKDGTNISGATSNKITVSETGDYTVTVTTGSGQTVTSDAFIYTRNVTSCSAIQVTSNNQKAIYNNSDANVTYAIKNVAADTIYDVYYKIGDSRTDIATMSQNATVNGIIPKPSRDSIKQFEVGYVSDGRDVPCNSYTVKYDVTNPSCSVSVNGTSGNNGWYKGSNVTFKLNFDATNETSITYGLTNSSTATYNSVSSTTITESTSGVKYYGFVKDAAGNTGSCNSGSSLIKFEKSDNVILNIAESTWNNLKSTRNNKLIFPGNNSSVWYNSSYGRSSSYKNIRTNYNSSTKTFTGIVANTGPVTNIPDANYYSRSCMNVKDALWESSLYVDGAISGIQSTVTNAVGKLCNWAGSDQNNIKYDYNSCKNISCDYQQSVTGYTSQNWSHMYCTGNNIAYRKWTITTNAGNSDSVSTYVEFFGQCGY